MNTYKVKISERSETHMIGDVVVMAESEDKALDLCVEAVNRSTKQCFCRPVKFTNGVVYNTDKSAWDGYH